MAELSPEAAGDARGEGEVLFIGNAPLNGRIERALCCSMPSLAGLWSRRTVFGLPPKDSYTMSAETEWY